MRNLASAALHEHDEIDIGVQGFVITRKTLGDLVSTLASLPPSERGSVPGIKPGRGDIILASALTIETVLEIGDFAGIEVTEASLRDGVFLARELLAEEDPLFDDVRAAAVRNLAIQYESDLAHVAHVGVLKRSARRTESDLDIEQQRVDVVMFCNRPGEIVGNRRDAHAAARADQRHHA